MRKKPTTKSKITKLEKKIKTLELQVRFLNDCHVQLQKRVSTMISNLPMSLAGQLDAMERSLRAHETQINSLWRTTTIKASKPLRK